MLNTPTVVVFGMVYDFLPFMILPIYNSMVRINKDVIEAARDLGANNLTVLVKSFSAHPLRRVKRNRHGLCAGTDLVRHLRPARVGARCS